MSRYRGPVKKLQKRFGLIPQEEAPKSFRKGHTKRKSEYGVRLEEKQKVKFIYGVQEKQFSRYMKEAFRSKGQTGVRLLQILETRLDRIILLAGFVPTIRMARQIVTHGHVVVNGKKVSIPSYGTKVDDVITLSSKMLENVKIQTQMKEKTELPAWLEKKGPVVKINRLPGREDIDLSINEQLIVEYYSR